MSGPISQFIDHHYRHFNAASLVDASQAYQAHLESGGKMLVTLAGAMSTAELGLSLAEMIRQGKIHAITCTGANLEEDIFNLVAHDHYERVPHYRDLTPADEKALLDRHMNRVTDTCIPEGEAMRRIEHAVLKLWKEAQPWVVGLLVALALIGVMWFITSRRREDAALQRDATIADLSEM